MKLFVDTCCKDLYIAIFKDNSLYKKIHIKNIVKKVEPLISEFCKLISHDISLRDDINQYYINIGPGSFTGARSALIYFKTFAAILNKEVFISNTFEIISAYSNQCDLYLNATKSNSFKWNCQKKAIYVVEKSDNETEIDYKKIEENISKVFTKFRLLENEQIIEPLYGKNPQIGSVK